VFVLGIGIGKQIAETADARWFCAIQATISRRICDFSYQLNLANGFENHPDT
jgi:hypothetical protein